jgi:hypothetical protein
MLNEMKTRFINLHTRTALELQLVPSIIEKYCPITDPPVKGVSGSAPGYIVTVITDDLNTNFLQ